MPTDVVMPQMGESIAEGTIVRWIKKVGDTVERDEPLFEISTDKVDAEIPSPAAGVITEIRAKEGETVEVNTRGRGDRRGRCEAGAAAAAPPEARRSRRRRAAAPPHRHRAGCRRHRPAPPRRNVTNRRVQRPLRPTHEPDADTVRSRSSPLVRKIAKEHNVDISQIHGTGISGRVTKNDILAFIGGGRSRKAGGRTSRRTLGGCQSAAIARNRPSAPKPATSSAAGAGLAGQAVPMSVMRRKIAEHMIAEPADVGARALGVRGELRQVEKIRQAKKAEYERAGAKLTYLSFILKAAVDALRAVPVVNASVDGDNIVYHKQVNVGIAVALDWGLIVPVVKNADEKNLLGLSRAVVDLANRARSKQLKPDEVSGGTFTITNPGVFGALFGMPIINQPQVAILGVGAVEKRPSSSTMRSRFGQMAYLSLGYDHRIIDGAVADEFMSHIKQTLEHWDPAQA